MNRYFKHQSSIDLALIDSSGRVSYRKESGFVQENTTNTIYGHPELKYSSQEAAVKGLKRLGWHEVDELGHVVYR